MKILIISHEAKRTGAPIILLHFLKWLRLNSSHSFMIISKKGGELEPDFQSLCNFYSWEKPYHKNIYTLPNKLKKYFINEDVNYQNNILSLVDQFEPDLIFANTVASCEIALKIKNKLRIPLIIHIHELNYVIQREVQNDKFRDYSKEVDLFITVSNAVAENLVHNYGIEKAKMKNVYEFIPAKIQHAPFVNSKELRDRLKIPPMAFVAGGSGTLDWRKSPETFIQVANYVINKLKPSAQVHFLWIGGVPGQLEYQQIKYDLKRFDIEQNVTFLPSQPNPLDYFNILDVFLLTSKEDPYPLVCLEAASLGKPVICFENAGGMPEFVENDAGLLAPFMDVKSMAKKIAYLVENPEVKKKLGLRAAEKVRERHDVDTSAKELLIILEEFMVQKQVSQV